jgi:gp16 family phage-associated protein
MAVEDVRAIFTCRGISIAEWARANGYLEKLVYRVLHAERLPLRGKSHDIAVHLGLKGGSMRPGTALALCPLPPEREV